MNNEGYSGMNIKVYTGMNGEKYTGMNSEEYTVMNSGGYTDLNRERPLFYKIKNLKPFHEGTLRSVDEVNCILNNPDRKWNE